MNLIGQKFARLEVISGAPKRGNRLQWRCCCECGGETITSTCALRGGKTKSCGCLVGEKAAARNRASAVHGESVKNGTTPEYRSWQGMKARCNNPSHHKYAIYGGRGIKVCGRWQSSFPNFLSDMGRKPSLQHSLDRYPDTDGNYEPGNCRWATVTQQNNNRNMGRKLS